MKHLAKRLTLAMVVAGLPAGVAFANDSVLQATADPNNWAIWEVTMAAIAIAV